jgi:hypothetical protein
VGVDVATRWTELEAIWGLGHVRVGAGIEHIRRRLPVPLREWRNTNGAEFVNRGLIAYCRRQASEPVGPLRVRAFVPWLYPHLAPPRFRRRPRQARRSTPRRRDHDGAPHRRVDELARRARPSGGRCPILM